VLVGGVVQHQLGDHPEVLAAGFAEQQPEVAQGSVGLVDRLVVGDVVAVVLQRRRVEGQQPQRGDPELLEVLELRHQAAQVPDPVAVRIVERPDVHLVDDGVLVPERGLGAGGPPAGVH